MPDKVQPPVVIGSRSVQGDNGIMLPRFATSNKEKPRRLVRGWIQVLGLGLGDFLSGLPIHLDCGPDRFRRFRGRVVALVEPAAVLVFHPLDR